MNSSSRSGTSTVEFALTFPLFLTFLFAVIEFSHALMTVQVLHAGARRAARIGVLSNATNTQLTEEARLVIQGCVSPEFLTLEVRDASSFDTTGNDENADDSGYQSINVASLNEVEISSLPSKSLFVVRTRVALSDVTLFSPRWITGNTTLTGRCVGRRE